jgi:hypothetical protein
MFTLYPTLGLAVGTAFLAVSLTCMLRQHTGDTTLYADVWGAKVRVKSSLPGIVFAVLGMLVILLTRPG